MIERTINIISRQVAEGKKGGPHKVFINTLRGLERIRQPYVINQNPEQFRFNWVQDDIRALIKIVLMQKPAIFGPNLFVFPAELPFFLPDFHQNIYLHPSAWCVNVWEILGFKRCPMRAWPAGIDIETFRPVERQEKNEVLLYHKKRKSIHYDQVKDILERKGLKVNLISYGYYSEDDYQKALKTSSFGVWVGTTESQGIGMQEALATNLPLIVIENSDMLDHDTPGIITFPSFSSDIKGTSVPYWDDRCGIVINRIEELEYAVVKMQNSIQSFNPREFIKETLSLEKCAKQLVDLFGELNFYSYDSGGQEELKYSKQNSFLFHHECAILQEGSV